MVKSLYLLIVLYNGSTYVQYKDLTLEHCAARAAMERQALNYVNEKHQIEMEFRCEVQ